MATPHFYINPLFTGLSLFSSKQFRTTPPTPPPPTHTHTYTLNKWLNFRNVLPPLTRMASKYHNHINYCVYNKIILLVFLYFWGLVWPSKLTSSEDWMNFLSVFVSFDDLLRLHFFTRCLYFYHNWWWEGGKNQFCKYFEGFCLKLRRKIWKFINTADSW